MKKSQFSYEKYKTIKKLRILANNIINNIIVIFEKPIAKIMYPHLSNLLDLKKPIFFGITLWPWKRKGSGWLDM
jgi:hypothetical protein